MWGAHNRRKLCPSELSALVFEALEVSETPRGDQDIYQEVHKSAEVTIDRACRVIMSSPGAVTDIGPASMDFRRTFDGPSAGVTFSVDMVT